MFYLISKHEKECFIWYPNTEKECLIWYPNTRRSVLFDIQTPTSNISNTRMSVSSDIQTPRSNKSNMRRSVYTIFNHREVIWYPRKRIKWIECCCFVCLPFSVSYINLKGGNQILDFFWFSTEFLVSLMNDICCLLFTAMFIYQNVKITLVVHTVLFLWFSFFLVRVELINTFNVWTSS